MLMDDDHCNEMRVLFTESLSWYNKETKSAISIARRVILSLGCSRVDLAERSHGKVERKRGESNE